MTESDYRWLTNDGIDPPPVIRVVAGSEWHYAQGGWHETDPVVELTAADIEAEQVEESNVVYEVHLDDIEAAPAELAEDEQEPDTETPEEESE